MLVEFLTCLPDSILNSEVMGSEIVKPSKAFVRLQ